MKTKTLFSLLAILFFSANILAGTPETITFTNVEQTEEGCVKEFIFCDKNTNAPLTKTTYVYDATNRMMEKSTYEWMGEKGWTGIQKYIYTYNAENQPQTPAMIRWDKKSNDWAKK